MSARGLKCGTTKLADECFDGLATGDVLLYRGNGIGAACTSFLLRSKWTHAGVVVRLPRDRVLKFYSADYTSVAASSAARESLHVLEAVPRRGVSLFPLEARLARTVAANRRVAVRQQMWRQCDAAGQVSAQPAREGALYR